LGLVLLPSSNTVPLGELGYGDVPYWEPEIVANAVIRARINSEPIIIKRV